jgi:transposase
MAKTELQEKWLMLRSLGLSYDKIYKKLGVSKQTQIRWNKKFSENVEALRNEELQATVEKLSLTKRARVVRFSSTIELIEDELSRRRVSELTTGALMRFYLQNLVALKNELEPIEIKAEVSTSMDRYLEILQQVVIRDDQNETENLPQEKL